MSQVEAQKMYLISTALGNVAVRTLLVSDFDVEDIVHNRAISQARQLQFINIGKKIDENALLPNEAIPTVFKDNEEELVE